MSASTAPREAAFKPGDLQNYKQAAVLINKGTLVVARTADGYAYPGRAGNADLFLGVAYETSDNSAGAAGGKTLRVKKSGSFVFALASAAQTNLGAAVYISDDQTLTLTATSNVLCGYITEIIDASNVRIRIDRAVQ